MTQYIKKLPAVFQTVTERKFFDATFDQVFSKKDSDLLAGYIGRRNPGSYNPVSDFYLPEPSKNRTWWQLEATAFARNEDTTKSNIFFYDDLLEHIEYYGGNTLNQDRLFESEYYSFGPPIDYDMFINYQNYYWVEQGLPVIEISGVLAEDIVGKSSYTTPEDATPANFTLSTGMTISLLDDPDYIKPHVVENFGGCRGIGLVQKFPDFTSGSAFEFIPWDGTLELSTGRIILNQLWDGKTWDTQAEPMAGDYITIERGSIDRNAWSRTNKWFHIDTITKTMSATSTALPSNATRALRPIIQFIADMPLYKSGTQFRQELQYGFADSADGNPILLYEYQGMQLSEINDSLDIGLAAGDLVCFFNDTTPINIADHPWDTFMWDTSGWATGTDSAINRHIFLTNVNADGTVDFTPFTFWTTPIVEGDIVFILEDGPYDSAQRGQTWYFSNGTWQIAFNDKVSLNQPPLFLLYDHESVPLDDAAKYPLSSFEGSKIFSYKVDQTSGAAPDPVLKFPIVYTSLAQASDILFENNLITDRYTYGNASAPIDGYYYYKTTYDPVLYNNWNLYQPCDCDDITPPPPCNCIETSKQRVIDKFVVGYGTEYQFRLSVIPYGYTFGAGASQPTADIIVSVNGVEIKSISAQTDGYAFLEINDQVYVDLALYLSNLTSTTQPPVVEIQTYTHGPLDPEARGYSAIPQQLEANPNQLEVGEISASDLTQHFSSIIANQIGITGQSFGGNNNYRDTRKNRSLGLYILQNISPLLKTMLVSSSEDLNLIEAVRFSQDEYTKFKNKYLSTALQLINQQFDPKQYHDNTINISAWVSEILRRLNVSKEFSNAFAYSYMAAQGSPLYNQTYIGHGNSIVALNNYVDLSDPKNVMYVYDVDGSKEILLQVGKDYDIISTNLSIEVQLKLGPTTKKIYFALYKNPIPTYIPSTPTKVGTYPIFEPRIEIDTSYAAQDGLDPYPLVIIGHDGSKTMAYGDYRDNLLLELETRIYNGLQYKYRNQYSPPLRLESVKPGFYRQTRYSRNEYLNITESYLNKWCAKNKANYRANDWFTISQTTDASQLWKLYNYRNAIDTSGNSLNLPGNWKGIFQYYYDTYYPDTRPWEMLGFTSMPGWWVDEYTTDWGSSNTHLWGDLEAGIIRQGPRAVYDPVTLTPVAQPMWARPGLSSMIPVDASGNIISVMDLFDVAYSGNQYSPFDGFDEDWMYGDGAPVEQAWMSTSAYTFSVQEFLFLMRPGPYGELMWDTIGTELSPGMIVVPQSEEPVMSNKNSQYVQNDSYTNDDKFFTWMRPKNQDQIVHAETINGLTEIRFGYQRWISDRILFLGTNVTSVFGQKVRTLDVNLANKLAGFTNKDTTNTYIESISPGSQTNSLIIPSTNFDVILHKSPVVDTYSYSGVIVRALDDGTFVVYGYDLLNNEFTVLDRSNEKLIDVSVGGTPSPFLYFTSGATYREGDIVRYNGLYYLSLSDQTLQKFDPLGFQKLKGLPTVGGVSVTYRPISSETITKIPYGSVLKTPQEVFDLMIGWGAYLESRGWKFDEVNQDTNQVSDWLYSAKQFLLWLNTDWAPDASIQLSPLANRATLEVSRGYPDDVETLSNGIYSILDKFGVAIAPNNTTTDREGRIITVEPTSLAAGGIFYLQINTSETEHILIFDNTTNFNDVVYAPLLRARQQRIRFNGFRSNGWYGKMEAPGYLVIDNQLVPNFDTIVESMRYFYDPNVTIDNPSLEDLGRHLIGYESKSYLDNLQLSNDVQYLFYQGAIRQKGTAQAFDKLFRSTKVQSNEIIEVYEEWALKLGNFGNTVEQISTEFILQPEQNTGEVVVARLNYIPSVSGFVKQINILNAVTKYVSVPAIIISAPSETVEGWRQARAYAVLDGEGRISRIDITDAGYGYLSAPSVTVDFPGTEDQLYAVWQGEITRDTTVDNIIEIDIDQTNIWTVRPNNPAYSLEFPVTPRVDYSVPNAGYVNFQDVDWWSFDPVQTAVKWGTTTFNPMQSDTVWVAKTFTEDWCVYKLVSSATTFDVIENAAGELLLRTPIGYLLTPQESGGIHETDFGNMIVLQGVDDSTTIETPTNYAVCFEFNNDDTVSYGDYNYYSLLTLGGTPITAENIPVYAGFDSLLLFKSMRFYSKPSMGSLPGYVSSGNLIWVDDDNDKWAVFEVGTSLTPYRVQEDVINTSLFESAKIYSSRTTNEIVQLPIYDPFKGIFPGPAKQNISYMSMQDPARYNVTSDERLFSENITFANQQVGRLWWDLSSVRYVYYEQPASINETSTENLVYRRNNWGMIFPGSTVDIYEWVQSDVPPAEYTGPGVPRDITSYVEISTSNRFTNITEVKYYFWVLGSTNKPNIENRTLAALDVARLLQSPKSQGFAFFSPIQQTARNNSYMFYNVQQILAYQGNNVQIQYRLAERNDQKHTQWSLFREGDTTSIVTDQYWDKLVDSICAYTGVLPESTEYKGIPVTGGVVLPVPDPTLSEGEKYGIEYRPRQGMFARIYSARKVFVQSANELLKHIPIRDNKPEWDSDVTSDIYWRYVNWYQVGYENAVPTIVFPTVAAAIIALNNKQLSLGTILQVTQGTPDGRYALYSVVQSTSGTLSLNKVCIEASAIELLDTVYTTKNVYNLSVELRQLMNAFRTQVMIDNYLVDQNELFFSMMNYVLSEQKTPNWLFKTSYIYIKENNLPLDQSQLYTPDQISNVTDYIIDSKPYHTQIRDYTGSYTTTDITDGTVTDTYVMNTKLKFGPYMESGNWDTQCNSDINSTNWVSQLWDAQIWGSCATPTYVVTAETFVDDIEQFISREDVYTVALTVPDPGKRGYSDLFPYTFTFDDINLNNPQTFVTPKEFVGVQAGSVVLIPNRDYFVEYNYDSTYTAYFFQDPSLLSTELVALVWINGGTMQFFNYPTHRNELAIGYPTQNFVMKVDTKNPLDESQIISYTQHLNVNNGSRLYRNNEIESGVLGQYLPPPTTTDESATSMVVTALSDVLPAEGAIWIEGERIVYNIKEYIGASTWELRDIVRGTQSTSATGHTVLVESKITPGTYVPNRVWVEPGNHMIPGSNITIWNAVDSTPDPSSEFNPGPGLPPGYSRITSAAATGIWGANTGQAIFLKDGPGQAIP